MRSTIARKRRGHLKGGAKCSNCHQPAPDGTRLHRGLCKRCRPAEAERTCSDCQKPPPAGTRLYRGECVTCRTKQREERAATAATAGVKGQLISPAIASFEMEDLRQRFERLQTEHRRTRRCLQIATRAVKAAARSMNTAVAALRRGE